MRQKALCILLTISLMMTGSMTVHASKLDDLRKQLKETQSQLSAVTGKQSGLQGKVDAVNEEIDEIDAQVIELMASITILEEEIEQKKEDIRAAETELAEAIAQEEAQYEAMKLRIRFMYEKGNATYAQLLLECRSLSDMLNKADYIERLYEYDRKMLLDYQEIRQKVQELKDRLEEEQSILEEEQYQLEDEKASLEEILEQKKAEAKNYEAQLSKMKQSAATYKALIKQQTAQIKQLEAEEAAKAAAANKNTTMTPANAAKAANAAAIISSASGSAKGKQLASYAIKFIGNPYVMGGTSLTKGTDCSGFTQSVCRDNGVKIPRNSTQQRSCGTEVSYSSAQPGDLVCYAGHVGMYIGGGYIVHASSPSTGIKISPATYRTILSVRRVV